MTKPSKPKCFILDVDGVMTTGHFIYSQEGKLMKIFGPDDNDGLSLVKKYLKIMFVTGDRKGFNISKKRIEDDMGYSLNLVSTIHRSSWIEERFKLKDVIYMGDGIFDHYVMKQVGYSIAPANADEIAKKNANYITKRSGGDRAVAEACIHILKQFFTPYNEENLPNVSNLSGEWTV